jgi:LysR family glycine cleavage system transcriptional activator
VTQAAIEGLGVALGVFPLIQGEVDAGRLVCPFDIKLSPTRSYHILTRPGARNDRDIRTVCEWIEFEARQMQS